MVELMLVIADFRIYLLAEADSDQAKKSYFSFIECF